MKGTIALDIDGTLTVECHRLPSNIAAYLSRLVLEGWRLVFITGRTFKSCYEPLKALTFPYYLAVQNGSIILEMPEKRIVSKKYLDKTIFSHMEEICLGEPSDFVIYGGFEHGDVSYYRPKRFSNALLKYLEQRMKGFNENWSAVESYDEMKLEAFPSIKCFGHYESALELTRRIEQKLGLHVPLIRDPFNESYYVVQATHPMINKGQALKDVLSRTQEKGKVIAAGDDLNDLSMLEIADIKIVMATAPEAMLQVADIIAPPATEWGIITGIEQAIKG